MEMNEKLINSGVGFLAGALTVCVGILIYIVIDLHDTNKFLRAQNKAFFVYAGKMDGTRFNYKECFSYVGHLTREYYLEAKKMEAKAKQ